MSRRGGLLTLLRSRHRCYVAPLVPTNTRLISPRPGRPATRGGCYPSRGHRRAYVVGSLKVEMSEKKKKGYTSRQNFVKTEDLTLTIY